MVDMSVFSINENFIIQRKVTEEDTALNYGSGSIEKLLATPRLIALAVEASARLIDNKLPEGYISAGSEIYVNHTAPTTIGETVSVNTKIEAIENNKISLSFKAYDEIGEVGKGTIVRYIVNKRILLEKANLREEKLKNLDY